MDITELGEFDLDGFMAGLKDGAETEALTNKVIKKQIILALDASNSMLGYKIGAVNDAVNNLVSKLKTLDRSAGCEGTQIAEQGTPEELLAKNGKYAELCRAQGLI